MHQLRPAIAATTSWLHTANVNRSHHLPDWLRGDPIAEALHAQGQPITKAAWLAAAYGSSNETVLTFDKDTREWVNRHFPRDPHEPVA